MSRAVHASLPISKLVKQRPGFRRGGGVLLRLVSVVNTLICASLFSGERRGLSASGGGFYAPTAVPSTRFFKNLRRSPESCRIRLTTDSVERLRGVRLAFGATKDKKVSGRISGDLLGTVKQRLGVTSDTEAIEIALANMAITDDFGAWLVDQAGQLSEDFQLEL